MRGATILWACLAIIAGSALFMLKYEVQAQNDRLRGLEREIVRARASIHVLKAEWSHLNDPMLLKVLAERHLGLTPQPVSRAEIIASLPMVETGDKAPIENAPRPAPPQPPAAFMAAAKPIAPALPAAPVVQANHQPQTAPAARVAAAPATSGPAPVAAAQPVRAAAAERPQSVAAPIVQPRARPVESRPTAISAEPIRRGNVVVITSPAALDRNGVIPVRTSP